MKQQSRTSLPRFILRLCVIILTIVSVRDCEFAQSASVPQDQESVQHPLLKVGDRAPDFSLLDFKGGKFNLAKFLKKNVVLLWFTNLCPGCQEKMSTVENLKRIYEKKGVEIAAVSVLGDDRKTVENTVHEKKLTLKFLYDPKGVASEKFGGTYTPGTCPAKNIYIIGRDGKLAFKDHLPGVDEEEIAKRLDLALTQVKK